MDLLEKGLNVAKPKSDDKLTKVIQVSKTVKSANFLTDFFVL